MVKTKAKWFAKEPERKVRINLAVLTLRGTKYSNETVGLGSKIAADLIASTDPYTQAICEDYICHCCR